MAEGPTTFNGPLHDDAASLDARKVTAFFATRAQADATRDALVSNGIEATCVTVSDASAEAAKLEPADDTLIGKIREAVLPDDGQRASRAAVKDNLVMLTVVPDATNGERIVDIIQAGKPTRFDAELERWRNAPPSA